MLIRGPNYNTAEVRRIFTRAKLSKIIFLVVLKSITTVSVNIILVVKLYPRVCKRRHV